MLVYLLLHNARQDNEAVHSLTVGDRNVVLMFESEDDATRYALLLEAQDFPPLTVEAIDREEIEQMDYEWQLVPAGFLPSTEAERLLLAPPPQNLPQASTTDDLRRRLEELL